MLGDKHPRAMGQRFADCWSEVFHILGPMAEQPFRGGPATKADDIALAINRRVPREESHFRLAYSPVPDDTVAGTGIGGVLATVTEITEQVYGERQLRTLRELAAQASDARTIEQACELAVASLVTNTWDVPFAQIYLAGKATPCATRGITKPLDRSLDLRGVDLPASPWGDAPNQAIALELGSYGTLVCGVNPHRALDDGYRSFFELVAGQCRAALRNANDYAEEQRRSEQLSALDRAKTTFFSNVSHEFRTPLTLMLGPTEDALHAGHSLEGTALDTVHRNELRLLRLVNTLLDFSRIEAGRIQATYEHLDLTELTRSLASTFEPAIVRGGLNYDVDLQPTGDDIYVDRDMWEKIVLNLLSNAFKFTFRGSIKLSLRREADHVALVVSDTGTGIPEAEIPRLFERFYRVEGARSRTNEGSGIGLALVHDLVALHGGTIDVQSEHGHGTTFRVVIPAGKAHLPPEHIGKARDANDISAGSKAFTAEALRWTEHDAPITDVQTGTRILLADDNADMRDYVARLLRAQGYAVDTAADGEVALMVARHRRPALVLTDIMMPKLDGFALIHELRADPATSSIPVIVLSARAGEEARIEGLDRGANDYLVKPFSARELIARVQALLAASRLARVETEGRARLEAMLTQAPVAIAMYRGPTYIFELVNALAAETIGVDNLLGKTIVEALPDPSSRALMDVFDRVYTTGELFSAPEFPVTFRTGKTRLFQLYIAPMREADNSISGLFTIGNDITDLVTARGDAERANRTKDEFIAMLGHELRNPLSPILTALDIMRIRDPNGRNTERDVIERQAQHLVRLVNDLLDVSRITQGKLELHPKRIELAQIVARAVETAAPLLEQRGHQLVVDVAFHGLVVTADPERLAQAIANLLTNAAKYTERGGTVTVSAKRIDTEITLYVRDNGIGIAADMLPHVFDMFVQERQALDRASGGLGLGLTIVKSLVGMHHGRVGVTSEGHNRGSEFTITLPAATARIDVPLERSPTTARATGGGKVLLVDDNLDAVDMLATSLELLGYDTRVAHDGPEALRIAADYKPDIALLDIGLPVMDGYELAGRMRGVLDRVKLVALTGYGTEADRARSKQAGFDVHLVKPVSLDAIRDVLAGFTR
ncbi:MAG: ATP-binding protein [Kofleriaceae bacterium]